MMSLYELRELNDRARTEHGTDDCKLRFGFTCEVDSIDSDYPRHRTRKAVKAAIKQRYEEYLELYAIPYGSKAAVKRVLGNVSDWYDGISRDD